MTGRTLRRFTLILFVLSLLVVAVHHHSTLQSHLNCTICKTAQHLDCGVPSGEMTIRFLVTEMERVPVAEARVGDFFFVHPANSRAPPCGTVIPAAEMIFDT